MMSKTLLCVFSVAVLFWAAEAVPPCRSVDNPNRQAQYFADSANCAGFYECSNGIPVHLYCPTGLYYDISLRTCNFKTNVHCGWRPQPPDVIPYDNVEES